ncbi:3-hydroxyisobutyrate dehydrogenase, mitochondrial isoform X2 [Anoplophora glabripennis]|uniref:3-hydroxyisobutyrate dehydrogenase, mitochondrial isoform X2 n=1 Tax=Anoplophora glabripennis TaxID=217634 RepID=UPI000875599B|nr:3-hydroxyisobutyrate dehydrogenase, mitochondrial isoform X2 [Anoplophora glabripennis]
MMRLFFLRVVLSKRHGSNIAFIGLGNMGSRMARNLIKKGCSLKIYDMVPSAKAAIQGATPCQSAEEAVKESSIVITMLPNGPIVKETILGEKGILDSVSKNSLIIDCSTVEPSVEQELSKIVGERGIRYLDAPVSGGIVGAEAATLTFMVGGEKKDVDEVEPILLHMGAKVHHCGKSGAGQIAKICNNLILGITMIGTAEALNLGVKLGLDPKLLTSIVNISSGRSWSSDTYNPVPHVIPNVPSCNDYKGGFSVPLIAKDLSLAQSSALQCGAPLPLGALAHQIYRTMITNGYEEKDFSSVYMFLKGAK